MERYGGNWENGEALRGTMDFHSAARMLFHNPSAMEEFFAPGARPDLIPP